MELKKILKNMESIDWTKVLWVTIGGSIVLIIILNLIKDALWYFMLR